MQILSKQNSKLKTAKDKCNAVSSRHASHTHCPTECRDEIQSPFREKCELEKAAHSSFVTSFDSLDIHLDRKNMTMDSQNKDFHLVNHQMAGSRVSGAMLDSSAPNADLLDVYNLTFLPSMEDQKYHRLNYIILWSRTLVNYFDVLAPLVDACIRHIPHKYSNKLSQKTKKVCFTSVVLESSQKYMYFIQPYHLISGYNLCMVA